MVQASHENTLFSHGFGNICPALPASADPRTCVRACVGACVRSGQVGGIKPAGFINKAQRRARQNPVRARPRKTSQNNTGCGRSRARSKSWSNLGRVRQSDTIRCSVNSGIHTSPAPRKTAVEALSIMYEFHPFSMKKIRFG